MNHTHLPHAPRKFPSDDLAFKKGWESTFVKNLMRARKKTETNQEKIEKKSEKIRGKNPGKKCGGKKTGLGV